MIRNSRSAPIHGLLGPWDAIAQPGALGLTLLAVPNLRPILVCPASTGGLERMFSALGRNHDDFSKKTLETTLETRMMVKHNFHDE